MIDVNKLKPGLPVKVSKLESIAGMTILPKHIFCRAAGVTGKALTMAAGHGGDVWFIQHDNSDDIGAYCYTELEPIE